MILINTITIIKIIILVKHLGAFYILGSLDDCLNYLYSYKLLFLTPSTGSILWTLATKEKLQMQIIMFTLGLAKIMIKWMMKLFFFFLGEKMNDEIVVQLRQKTFLPWPYTIVYSMHLMKVKLDHLLGGKCVSKKMVWRQNIKVIDSVPYWPVRPEYTIPASNPVRSTPLFHTGKNTGHTDLVPAVPANFGQYRLVQKFFFFFFLSFVIFEFLLG